MFLLRNTSNFYLLKYMNMKASDFLELFFIIAGGMAMPFIVLGSYFNLVKKVQRGKTLEIFFLTISILYALIYSYFAWKSLKNSPPWKRIVKNVEEKEKLFFSLYFLETRLLILPNLSIQIFTNWFYFFPNIFFNVSLGIN